MPAHRAQTKPLNAEQCICITVHPTALKALADPRRFEIVEFLAGGERSVSEIVKHIGIDQSGVSRHLQHLQGAGLLDARRDGQRRLYRLRPDPLQELEAWVQKYRSLWDARLDRLERHLVQKRK